MNTDDFQQSMVTRNVMSPTEMEANVDPNSGAADATVLMDGEKEGMGRGMGLGMPPREHGFHEHEDMQVHERAHHNHRRVSGHEVEPGTLQVEHAPAQRMDNDHLSAPHAQAYGMPQGAPAMPRRFSDFSKTPDLFMPSQGEIDG